MCEKVRVITRCRPFTKKELREGTETIVDIDSLSRRCYLRKSNGFERKKNRIFSFDGVYGTRSTTEEIYTSIVHPIVAGVLDGYNGTVFAYGQTSCGKTFTMQGIEFSPSHKGIIPRCCEHIFNSLKENGGNSKYLVRVSYLEIYNEVIRDLLVSESHCKHEIKEHPERGIYVKDLSCVAVDDLRDVEEILSLGSGNRSVGTTLLNSDSSRSHSIFSIDLEVCVADADSGKDVYRTGKLNLVDLAGSERQRKSGATGDRFKEATKINLSLSVLGNVISALVDCRAKHVPYRDSKLTRLLQDSLGGNSKTLMVACISPGANNYEETLSTLRYAKRAKSIQNKPRINADPKDSLLQKYHDEISLLKRIIAKEITVPQGLASELTGSAEDVGTETSSAHKAETESKLREYRVELLQTQRLHSEACEEAQNLRQELDDLKTQLRIQQRRTEHERRRRELEEHRSALLLLKSRRVAYGASATTAGSFSGTKSTSQTRSCEQVTSRVTSDTSNITLSSVKVTSQEVRTSFELTSQEVKVSGRILSKMTSQRFSPDPEDIQLCPDYFEDDSSSGITVDSKGDKFSDDDICDKETFMWDVDVLEREAPLAEEGSPLDDEGESPLTEVESPLTEEESPLSEEEPLLTEMESPLTEEESLLTEVESPLTEEESPLTEEESPLFEEEPLLTEMESPLTEKESPLTEEESPRTEKESLPTEEESPLTEVEPPLTEVESPLTEVESSHDNIGHMSAADGRSRSASPRTGDEGIAKEQSRKVPDVQPLRKLEVEDPVPLALCCLCAGVSFFGEKNHFVTSRT